MKLAEFVNILEWETKGGNELKKFRADMNRLAKLGGKAALALAGLATTIGTGLFIATTKTSERLDVLGKQAESLGLSVEFLDRFTYAAGLADISQEKLTGSLKRFLKASGDAATGDQTALDAFELLGVNIRDAQGKLKDTPRLINDIADGLAKIDNQALRATAAQDLFGRSGVDLLRVLQNGSGELGAYLKEADQYALITATQAKEAAEFNDNLDRLKRTISRLTLGFTSRLIPIFDRWTVAIRDYIANNGPKLEKVFDDLGSAFETAGELVAGLVSSFVNSKNPVRNLALVLGTLTAAIIALPLLSLISSIAILIPLMGSLSVAGGLVFGAIIAIAAAVAGVVYLFRNWDKVVAVTTARFNLFVAGLRLIKDYIVQSLEPAILRVTTAFEKVNDLARLAAKFGLIGGPIGATLQAQSAATSILNNNSNRSSVTNSSNIKAEINVRGGPSDASTGRAVRDALYGASRSSRLNGNLAGNVAF